MKNTIKFYVVTVLTTIFATLPMITLACPNCKDAYSDATNSTAQAGLGSAYSVTILMLIGVPITMIALFATKVVRQMRKAEAERMA